MDRRFREDAVGIRAAALLALGMLFSGRARPQPNRQIDRLIVPFAAGRPIDSQWRLIGQWLSSGVGEVVVDL
jgi:tripartite-type tricarboxylate transporter receptor subunit TctC